MATLPMSYMNVIRDLTAYWGTYPPSNRIAPGMIGRVVGGRFVAEGAIDKFPEYDKAAHSVQRERNSDDEMRWMTSRVKIDVFAANARARTTGVPVSLNMKIQFGAASEAILVCRGGVERSFSRLDAVKDLMRELLEQGKWDKELCVVTHVLEVDAARIFFSTSKDQTAELKATAASPNFIEPLAILQPSAKVGLVASSTQKQFTGFFSGLSQGATPLFMAIRFNQKRWWAPTDWFRSQFQYLRGGSEEFEEPPFGEARAQSAT